MNLRAYQSLEPANSKILQQKWDTFSYELHRTRLKSVKHGIDSARPKTYPHLEHKLKKKQLEEERAFEFWRERNILSKKIANIKKTKGGTDTWNDYKPRVTTETYQSYQSLFPTKSKYLQLKWDKCTFDKHRTRVKSAKPLIDNTQPKIHPHLATPLKKLQLEEDRAMEVQRENNILNTKISVIKRTKGGVDSWNYAEKKRHTRDYQAYQSLFPNANRYLQHRWEKSVYELRKKKVMSVKPRINATAPKSHPHLAVKLKKLQLEAEREMEVQRENNILMDKITHIMKTAGDVDCWNFYDKKREERRLAKGNKVGTFRLGQGKPQYSMSSWNDDWLKDGQVHPKSSQQGKQTPKKQGKGEKEQKKQGAKEDVTGEKQDTEL